jgi:hypothetical protein
MSKLIEEEFIAPFFHSFRTRWRLLYSKERSLIPIEYEAG